MRSEAIVSSEAAGSTEIPDARIVDLVEEVARRSPEAPALVVTAERIPLGYRDLVQLVDDLAGQLRQAGLRAGDRVALRSASNAEFVVGLLAASR
ncbi:AMP-binding protein, partial [Mycobacterium sp. E1715]|uniref:AMP-binding protein n=2 Tax=unclassified Mycobacterium TaxID=2642494 RepID=UPI000AC03E67